MQLVLIVRAFYDDVKAKEYVGHHSMNEYARMVIEDLDKVKNNKEFFIGCIIQGAEKLWDTLQTKGDKRGPNRNKTHFTV